MGKTKSENSEEQMDTTADKSISTICELTYEDKILNTSVIANPMASKKLTKKCYKLVKKAMKQKTYLRKGLKEVQSRIRKGETGIVLFAGDVTPIEIMCHLPGVCEDKSIPYCYIPSRVDLGAAMGVKRASLMVMIRENAEYKEGYDELKEEIKHLAVKM